MYACFDQPDQKATFTISAITPKHWEVISNYDIDFVKELGSDTKLVQFKESQVISTYVTAIVAGPYQSTFTTNTSAKKLFHSEFMRASLSSNM